MCDPSLLSKVVELLRPVSKDVFNGKGKLCLSTVYLQKLNSTLETYSPEELASSFHSTENKFNLQRDLQSLQELITGTISLKLTPDLVNNEETNEIVLKRFTNLKVLEIHKLDIKTIIGIQKLRSQIEELTCIHSLNSLDDILEKCGGDFSQGNLWNALKKANFAHNQLTQIDKSLDWTPWLTILDLSHNQLTNVDFINNLPNLKHLNISFNKLNQVPKFKGQICKRLQVLTLNNNFIEDISGLGHLSTIVQLDLSQNCIMDHNVLLYIGHLASLNCLNIQRNPISFHPHHRNTTCQYLNKNVVTLNLLLDNIPLNKIERSFTGSRHPISQSSLSSSNNSSLNSLECSSQEKQKRVRNVTIHESNNIVTENKKVTPVSTPKSNMVHLEMKKQVEQLRESYGDYWLHRQSGIIFQDVLGFEKSSVLSSTPSDANPSDLYFEKALDSGESKNDSAIFETASDEIAKDEASEKANITKDTIEEDFFASAENSESEESAEKQSLDDEDANKSEIFYAYSDPNNTECDLCLMVSDTYLSEMDSVSLKKKSSWSFDMVIICRMGEAQNAVHLEFDTVRKDRKSRDYYMEESEIFVNLIQSKVKEIPQKKVTYQCMKCDEYFSIAKKNVREEERRQSSVICPKCNSDYVIIKQS
ncbi:hypothetical protein GWI33_016377 [Rhynchophorus ferrugineus]|uniref:Serine/threonine-protein kinase 11-interacting protein n=1 Tax=Rhynchophorus ferrugineus TaxID=354439 RepID=A0A834M3D4_RHYFE|nr:hypothetical protein GWI33_016377 [Rhynchophorus ferrugineus]